MFDRVLNTPLFNSLFAAPLQLKVPEEILPYYSTIPENILSGPLFQKTLNTLWKPGVGCINTSIQEVSNSLAYVELFTQFE